MKQISEVIEFYRNKSRQITSWNARLRLWKKKKLP